MHEYMLSQVSDATLLRDLTALVADDRVTTAKILAHIAEVDTRRLYAPAGYESMFAFCVEELRLSEDAAYKRIRAARAARRFPALFTAVAESRLHLAAVYLLAPHLTAENEEELIQAATHRSKAEIEAMLARRFPVSGMPVPPQVVRAISCAPILQLAPGPVEASRAGDAQLRPAEVGDAGPGDTQPAPTQAEGAAPPPEHYLLQLTIAKDTYDKLRYAQALLSHAVPSGEVARVFDRALDALIGKLEERRFGAGPRARRSGVHPRVEGSGNDQGSRPRAAAAGTRAVPARVRRAVWERDGGRCTFVGARGHRCGARRFLEYDHVVPVARGGTATVENLRLRCRAHNQYEADRVFGAGFMRRKRTTPAHDRAALAQEHPAPARARAMTHEEHEDLMAGLRSLGCRGEMARRAAEFSGTLQGITLEERLRAALQFIGRRSTHGGTPARGADQGASFGENEPEMSTRDSVRAL